MSYWANAMGVFEPSRLHNPTIVAKALESVGYVVEEVNNRCIFISSVGLEAWPDKLAELYLFNGEGLFLLSSGDEPAWDAKINGESADLLRLGTISKNLDSDIASEFKKYTTSKVRGDIKG